MPNWINFVGPTFPVENGSAMGAIDAVVKYTLKIIKKMQAENIKYWVPRQDITDDFNDHVQTWYKGTVWGDDCHSWCKFLRCSLHIQFSLLSILVLISHWKHSTTFQY